MVFIPIGCLSTFPDLVTDLNNLPVLGSTRSIQLFILATTHRRELKFDFNRNLMNPNEAALRDPHCVSLINLNLA